MLRRAVLVSCSTSFKCVGVNMDDIAKRLSCNSADSVTERSEASAANATPTPTKTERDGERENKKKRKKGKKRKSEEETKPAKPPNFFLAVQVDDSKVKGCLKAVQEHIVEQERLLQKAVVDVASAHLTLGLLHLPDDESVAEASALLQSCKNDLNSITQKSPISLGVTGIGHFHSSVVFAKVVEDNEEKKLREISELLQEKFLPLKADNEFSYMPHLTLMKLSKIREWKTKKKIRRIKPEYYETLKHIPFGIQQAQSVQLLSMFKKKRSNGYYHCEAEVSFGSFQKDHPETDSRVEYAKFLSSYCVVSGVCEVLTPLSKDLTKENELNESMKSEAKQSAIKSYENESDGCAAKSDEHSSGDKMDTRIPQTQQQEQNTNTDKLKQGEEEGHLGRKSQAQKFPNYFLAVQITDPQIKCAMKAVQDEIVERNRLLEKVVVDVADAHFTLGLLHLPDDSSIEKACNILAGCKKHLDGMVSNDTKLDLTISGLDHFDKQVVYAKLTSDEGEKKLRDIAMYLREEFRTVEADDPYGYNPHLTLLKLAKIRSWRHKNKIPCIEPVYFESRKNTFFGVQSVRSVQLLAMSRKKRKGGYYHCEMEIPLGASAEACDVIET